MQIAKRSKGARYTPVSKRNDRPDAIAFLLRNFPQLSEQQIVKLLGTTKDTIAKVRDKQHWNSPNIKPRDPVILGLCSQMDLNSAVAAANERIAKDQSYTPMPSYEHSMDIGAEEDDSTEVEVTDTIHHSEDHLG